MGFKVFESGCRVLITSNLTFDFWQTNLSPLPLACGYLATHPPCNFKNEHAQVLQREGVSLTSPLVDGQGFPLNTVDIVSRPPMDHVKLPSPLCYREKPVVQLITYIF